MHQTESVGAAASLEWARWLDSMEGVPEWREPAPRRAPPDWQQRVGDAFARLGELAPGIVLALGLAVAGGELARWLGTDLLGFEHSPITAVPVAIVLGLLVRNVVGVPAVYEPGLRVCVRFLLRVGIVLLGLRLSLGAAGVVGLTALPVIGVCIVTALVAVTWLGRVVGLPRRLAALIAVGTSICGVSAIVAAAAAIDAEDDEISYAVACVTLFGLLALFCHPYVAHGVFGADPQLAGIFLGTAIHDTAQVAGAALIYQQQFDSPQALEAATVTKLIRNTCMAAVIPLMAVLYLRPGASRKRLSWHQAVPFFVVAFVIAVAARTVGDLGGRAFGVIGREAWWEWLGAADRISFWCLTLAMVAVGLGTGLAKLRVLGLRPIAVGLAAAVLVGGVSLGLLMIARSLGLT
jgi:uncharacterized integral membrane protein (TIGR00698 family)